MKAEETEQLKNGLSLEEQQELTGQPEQKKRNRPPLFYKFSTVPERKRNAGDIFKSGIYKLDGAIMGFAREELIIVSGTNGSGKSSLLSQFAIEFAEQNVKTAIFSGELLPEKVRGWIRLQAAGRLYTEPSDYENVFFPKAEAVKKIDRYYEDRIFIYNNTVGQDAGEVLTAMKTICGGQGVKVVILDNLMTLNLGRGDKYEAQTAFVRSVSEFAKEYNVVVFLVCHPRKATGFLRKDDIAGTADITNLADTVIIAHRVNRDFKRLGKDMFGWKDGDEIFTYSNVIEVTKHRETGVQDYFAGVFYEKQSKRYLNSEKELKSYGWI